MQHMDESELTANHSSKLLNSSRSLYKKEVIREQEVSINIVIFQTYSIESIRLIFWMSIEFQDEWNKGPTQLSLDLCQILPMKRKKYGVQGESCDLE